MKSSDCGQILESTVVVNPRCYFILTKFQLLLFLDISFGS